jgi:hypothetical protein
LINAPASRIRLVAGVRELRYNPGNMMRMTLLALGMVAVSNSFALASTITVTQTWNAKGYGTYDFTLAQDSLVDIQVTSAGVIDPTLSLLNSAGVHLILADDEQDPNSRLPHLTQNLGAGSYSLLLAYCCEAFNYFSANGGVEAFTDGVNEGFFLVGGTGTLSGAAAHLDSRQQLPLASIGATATFTLSVTGGSPVPVSEPGSLFLVPIALAGLAAVTRFPRG